MPTCKPSLDRQRGFALTEIILAIVIVVGGIIGGISLFHSAQLQLQTEEGARLATTLSSEVRSIYRISEDFDDVSTQRMIDLGTVPASFLHRGEIRLRSNARVQVNPLVTGAQYFQLRYIWPRYSHSKMDSKLCTRLSQPPNTQGYGVLGENYRVDTADCNNPNQLTLVIRYFR